MWCQPIEIGLTTLRRIAYQTANGGDGGGEKYWQIMRESASPERRANGLGKGDTPAATDTRVRFGFMSDYYLMQLELIILI